MTRDQYEILNEIRKRTDAIIDGEIKFETLYHLSTLDSWKFFKKSELIDGEIPDFSTITFQGRVALAAYEEHNDV